MRYSHRLRRYNFQSHFLFSTIILTLTAIVIIVLIFVAHVNSFDLVKGLLASTIRVFIAYLITLPIALAIVIAISKTKKLEDFFVPVLDVSQSFPTFAVLPLILAISGRGTISIILFLIITLIWPIIFTTLASINIIKEDLQEAALVFGAKGLKLLIYVTIPAIFPSIVTGSIVGWGNAWEAIVGAEIIAGRSGIGAFIGQSYDQGNKQVFVLSIIILMLFIFFLNKLIWLPLLKRSTAYQTE